MPVDIGVDVLVEVQEVRKHEPKRLVAKEGRVRILEGDRGNEDLPATFPITPPYFAALHLFQRAFRARHRAFWIEHQLPEVLLAKPKMQTKPQHQE